MIVGTDPISNLPVFQEGRPLGPYRALPRPLEQVILALDVASQWTVTYAKPDASSGALFLSCWKCGRPLNSWRATVDRTGRPVVLPDGRGAASLLPLDCYRETRFGVYLPRRQAGAAFTVLHCSDCGINEEHAETTLAIHLAAHDQQYVRHRPVSPPEWAQFCWQWGDAELRGKVSGPLPAHQGV